MMFKQIICSLVILMGLYLPGRTGPGEVVIIYDQEGTVPQWNATIPGLNDTIPGLNDTIRLEDVTISVIPFQVSYAEAAGSVFSVNTGNTLQMFDLTSTGLINLVPGVHMASGTYNTNRLVIRGVGSRTPYGTNRIRAYLDDIPLTSGDGISTVEDLDLSTIGNMEILKGPSSALYGSGLGGIIRFNSLYPRSEGLSASLSGEQGSYNTGRLGGSIGFKRNRLAVSGILFRSFSGGYRENSNYARTNAFLNMRYFGNRNNLTLTLSLVDLFARIPSSLNETDFLNEPWKAADNWLAVQGHETYLKVLGGMKLESMISDRFRNHFAVFSSFSDPYESRPFNILDDRNASVGFREYLQYESSAFSLSAGLEYFNEWYSWQIFETVNGTGGMLLSDHDEVRKYANSFAFVQWRPTGRILIDGGLNLNLLDYQLQTNFMVDSSDHSGSYSYQPVLSPRIGISYKHHGQHYLYASGGHGFSAPSLEETLLPEGNINAELKPETGWNMEAGHRGRMFQDRLRYDATIYVILLSNLLVTERISEDIFTGANAGRAINAGLELWARYTLRPEWESSPVNLRATLGYTFSRNRFVDFVDDGVDYAGNALPGIPVRKLNSIISGRLGPAELDLIHGYTGRQWMNDANDLKNSAFHLLHLHLKWRVSVSSLPVILEFKGGIRNIFNTLHASMILVNAPSFGGNPPRYYYPGLPRQFHLGATIRFQ